jgi:hypothetical protein
MESLRRSQYALDLYLTSSGRSDPAWAFPIRTDCVTIFLNVVARGGTVRWNRHITPDLCLATSWLHALIYTEILLFIGTRPRRIHCLYGTAIINYKATPTYTSTRIPRNTCTFVCGEPFSLRVYSNTTDSELKNVPVHPEEVKAS